MQVMSVGESPAQLEVRWPGGKATLTPIPQGADEIMVEQLRLFLGQDQYPSGSVSETFEQMDRLLQRLCVPVPESTGGGCVCCTRGQHGHQAPRSMLPLVDIVCGFIVGVA